RMFATPCATCQTSSPSPRPRRKLNPESPLRFVSNHIIMKTRLLLALVSTALAGRLSAADATPPGPPPTDAVIVDHAVVDNALAKGLPILLTTNYKIQTGRRVMPGKVEIHERDTDIFYILEGTATFTTGGTPNGTKTVRPGEISGDTITGGTPHK